MKLTIPTSYTAGRKVTLFGTTYQPGASIPAGTVKTLRNLSVLLGRRLIIPNADPHNRRNRLRTPTPTDISAVFRRKL
jgi:hypothetical protein